MSAAELVLRIAGSSMLLMLMLPLVARPLADKWRPKIRVVARFNVGVLLVMAPAWLPLLVWGVP